MVLMKLAKSLLVKTIPYVDIAVRTSSSKSVVNGMKTKFTVLSQRIISTLLTYLMALTG